MAQIDGRHKQTMKNKIPQLTVITLAAMAMVGCERQPASSSTDQQTSSATNSAQAGAPTAPDTGNHNAPAATNTNNPASTNQ
jgi:hypothetical protein